MSDINEHPARVVLDIGGGMVVAPDWSGVASLNAKMAKVMGEISTLQKDAKHQQGWTYVSYSEVSDAIRKAMAKANLGLFVHVVDIKQVDTPKGIKSMAVLEFTFADGDTGAMKVCRWEGEAVDFGTADKGMAKAYTSTEKYFLMRTFLVSTSDDVEPDDDEGKPPVRARAPRPAPAPQPMAVPPVNGETNDAHSASVEGTQPTEPPEWQDRFFGWLGGCLKNNKLERTTTDAYRWLQEHQYMNPHLGMYAQIGHAQNDALNGVKFYKEAVKAGEA
jgi:hypothetical protein